MHRGVNNFEITNTYTKIISNFERSVKSRILLIDGAFFGKNSNNNKSDFLCLFILTKVLLMLNTE